MVIFTSFFHSFHSECLLSAYSVSGMFSASQTQQQTKQEKSSPYEAYPTGRLADKQIEKITQTIIHLYVHELHSMTDGNIAIEKNEARKWAQD